MKYYNQNFVTITDESLEWLMDLTNFKADFIRGKVIEWTEDKIRLNDPDFLFDDNELDNSNMVLKEILDESNLSASELLAFMGTDVNKLSIEALEAVVLYWDEDEQIKAEEAKELSENERPYNPDGNTFGTFDGENMFKNFYG